jgi:UDP-N-acetylglucosamine 4-epimerase
MHILVTGGAGFIGSNIVKFLLENNHTVRVIDNLITGHLENINEFIDHPNFEFILCDITNIDDLRKNMCNIDAITHQAALGSVPRSVNDPLTSHNTNVNGFLNILIVAKELNIKRIVYASSSSVYGDNNELPKIENKIGNQLSPYAITKYIDELYARIFTQLYDLECIGLRYFNVFGPKQDPNGVYAAVIPKFITQIKNNLDVTINGDGNNSRDFTYIDNVVRANYLALTTDNKQCFGEIFNIGAGGRITILEMFNIIKNILNSDKIPIFGPNRKGDIPHSNADIEKAKLLLNYDPKISFEEGIIKTIDYYV